MEILLREASEFSGWQLYRTLHRINKTWSRIEIISEERGGWVLCGCRILHGRPLQMLKQPLRKHPARSACREDGGVVDGSGLGKRGKYPPEFDDLVSIIGIISPSQR